MKAENFSDALSKIDDKYIKESATYTSKKKSRPHLKWGSLAACLSAFVIATAIILLMITSRSEEPTVVPDKNEGRDEAGGINGKINICENIVISGEEDVLSDTEASSYLEARKESIESDLVACGVKFKELQIAQKGYSHVRTGKDGNTMAVNWRDHLAYDGEKIIATIAVVKENGKINHHIAWGSDYSYYEKKLEEYKGKELVYLYIGDVDAFITPDNKIFTLSNIDISMALDDNTEYYEFFKTQYNVYVP